METALKRPKPRPSEQHPAAFATACRRIPAEAAHAAHRYPRFRFPDLGGLDPQNRLAQASSASRFQPLDFSDGQKTSPGNPSPCRPAAEFRPQGAGLNPAPAAGASPEHLPARHRRELQEIDRQLRHVRSLIAAIQHLEIELGLHAEKIAVQLAFHTARQVIGEALQKTPAAAAGILKCALEKAKDLTITGIKLNPADMAWVGSSAGGPADFVAAPENLPMIPDPTITPGGCIVETLRGDIDARLESQYRLLQDALNAVLQTSRRTSRGLLRVNEVT